MARRIEKNAFDDFVQVDNLPGEGRYKATVAGFREQDRMTKVVTFNPENIDKPEEQYTSIRAYLNKRYKAGDLTASFMKVFNKPKTEEDVLGKQCYIEVEYRGSEDKPYLTVTEIESI